MSTPNGTIGVRPPAEWHITLARLGDVGLAFLYAFFAVASTKATIVDAPDETLLATVHHAASSVVLWQFALLFVLRRPASLRIDGWVPRLVAIVGSWTMPIVIWLPLKWTPDWLLVTTTAGLVGAYLILIWSLLTLRRSFSIFAEARDLIRSGPYGIVRHPLYATYMAMYCFLVLPRISPVAVLVAALGVACEMLRARDEEQVLRAAFPEYQEYAATTPRFIPRTVFSIRGAARTAEIGLAAAERTTDALRPAA